MERRIDRQEPVVTRKSRDAKLFRDLVALHRQDVEEVGIRVGRSKDFCLISLTEMLGHLKIAELDRERLIKFGRDRAKEGAGPVTLGMDFGYIKTVLSYAAAVHGVTLLLSFLKTPAHFLCRGHVMELRHLRYFIAVAEHESIRLAAQRIHVTQPAISRQIQDLETELGFLLFERQRNRLVLTPAGRSYLEEARLALARLNAAAKSGLRLAKGLIGQLRIGFVENAGWDGLVPDAFARFQETAPDVDLELRPQNSPQQIEDILSGALDGGFIYQIGALPAELVAIPLIEQGVLLAAPLSWAIANGGDASLRSLADRPFILFPRAVYPPYHDLMIEACRRIDVTLNVIQEEHTETAILALVCSGVGAAIVNAANLSRPLARATFSRLTDLSLRLPLVFVHRVGNDSPLLARFLCALDH